ncbi:hypothetical protein [Salinibacterium sp. CAN_S4]|uniref:hypothetical protein n=1 Tax=Salinibacterium sp. CAN_S4 TaxID=2787727 RepID=UPI002FEF93E9
MILLRRLIAASVDPVPRAADRKVDDVSERRPTSVLFAVVVLYIAGIVQIVLGIVSILLRYSAEATADGLQLPITLLGVAAILFGLFVIALASGVARGSRMSCVVATVVMVVVLGVAIADLLVARDGDWSGVAITGVSAAAVVIPLWSGAGRRFSRGSGEQLSPGRGGSPSGART